MKAGRTVLVITALLFTLAACSSSNELRTTEYDPNNDVYVMFQGEIAEDASALLPAEVIGQKAFELQEGTHESITDVSGAEIDHYYIWVCLGSDCIPVDPFRFNE